LVEINESSFVCKRSPRRNVVELLKLCKKYEVPVVFDSDCHFCQLIGQTPKVAKIAEELDFPEKLIMNSDWEKIREYVLAKRPNLDI
ncbi:MAG: phosphatase, partial [Lachnospiraceae bacterium]|nr:phosphatase [Lachnospiraceae bacterium]